MTRSLSPHRGASWWPLLLALAGLLACTGAQAARVALVIGNAAYADSPLKNPVNDARAVDAKLRTLGFAVTRVENLRRDQIGRTLTGFASRIQPGDEVVVFYAGHGLQVKGVNYLPAVDAQIQSEADVPLNSVNLGALLEQLDDAKAGVKILLLDACRNNPYARSFRSASRGLSRVQDAPSGTLMHFATRPGSVAADGSGANGLYTSELIRWMDQPGVPVEQMFKRVAAGVRQASGGEQEPWVEGSLQGDFFFRAAVAAAPMESRAGGSVLDANVLAELNEGALVRRGFKTGPKNWPMCNVNVDGGGSCRVEAFESWVSRDTVEHHTCARIDRAVLHSGCVDGRVHGLATFTVATSLLPKGQRMVGLFIDGRILYPSVYASVDGDANVLLGLQALANTSFGCAYYPVWDSMNEHAECRMASGALGGYLMSRAGAEALRAGTLDAARVAADFARWWRASN